MNKYNKENKEMYNTKEIFSEENFGTEELDKMIDSAINLYVERNRDCPYYFWISYDSLEAVEAADDEEEFEGLENGFIIEVGDYYWCEEDMETIARSFIDFFNEEYGRNFDLIDSIDKEIINYDEKLFTNSQLIDICYSCYDELEFTLSDDPYYIIVDMEKYECIGTTDIPDYTKKNYEYMLVDPSLFNHRRNDYWEECQEVIENHFKIKFEFENIYYIDIIYSS